MQPLTLAIMFLLLSKGNPLQLLPFLNGLDFGKVERLLPQAEELLKGLSDLSAPVNSYQNEDELLKEENPLDPIKDIADEKLINALAQYVAIGE